ncbi:DUF3299 domain-containing protein [Fibrella forsythiae]|uniref:DUF3299 domain-containing protein n=1 Tax=Fibrella forsythiae TaxID=2817061 RepID=A0ABS3JKY1_9BACT|nr:DUF3299 domain-containing protein [Fibrella forsythiae]MBO0950652.1 DUF3299 domain-containing protein [Fibrella forsythiae]
MPRFIAAVLFLSIGLVSFRPVAVSSLAPALTAPKAADPVKLSWESLRDVTFKKKWYAEESVYMLYPTFGPAIQKMSGKPVELTGYVLPVDLESNVYVLSAFPYSACFFCGGAGPESVVSLKFKKPGRKFKTDERRTFRGTLKLNADNIYELNYIIADAEMIES